MRTNIVLDENLVQEAFRLTDARTKKELIHLALKELIRVRRKRNLAELAGRVRLRDDFDHKAMRDVRSDDR
jgi:Arc/MetJ family transcription regulator